MTTTSPGPEPSPLADRLHVWVGDGRALEDAILAEIQMHRRALDILDTLLASTRDAIDRMRSTTAEQPPQ